MPLQVSAVKAKTYFGREKDLKSIHSTFYHGCASRCGLAYPAELDAYLTNNVRDSLEVVRSGHLFPAITRPASSLVCTTEVADALKNVQHCEVQPVILTKVVDCWIAKGDMSFYDNSVTRKWADKERGYLEHFPDARDQFRNVPQLWELLVPKLIDVTHEFDPLSTVEFYFGEPPYGDKKGYSLSQSLFDKYPIVRQAGVSLFRSDVFERIEAFIDTDFFCVCSREVL